MENRKTKLLMTQRWLFITLTSLIVLIFWSASGLAENGTPEGQSDGLREIRFLSIYNVLPGFQTKDARLSLEMIMRKTMARETMPFKVKLDFLEDYSNAANSIVHGRYHFVTICGLDYVDMRRHVELNPMMVLSKLEQPTDLLFLITRKGDSLDRIGRKPKSTLVLRDGRIGIMARTWLDTVLWESGHEDSKHHFTEIQYALKSSRIVLPVFFGKADACVVTASSFDLMSDLNPQLSNHLEIQKRSQGLVSLLLCSTALAQPEDKEALSAEAQVALNDPYSKQALTIVQMKRFFGFRPEYMDGTEALFDRYQQLAALRKTTSAIKPKATPAP